MPRYLIPIFEKRDVPKWFARLNYLTLLPIIIYPFVFPVGLYLLYLNLKEIPTVIILFLYPGILIANVLISFRLYRNNPTIAVILPCAAYIAMLYGICSLL